LIHIYKYEGIFIRIVSAKKVTLPFKLINGIIEILPCVVILPFLTAPLAEQG